MRRNWRRPPGGGFAQVTEMFFDRVAVLNAITKAEARVYSKFGAYVRQRAMSSLRMAGPKARSKMTKKEWQLWHIRARRAEQRGRDAPPLPDKVSAPGKPPKLHIGLRSRNPLRRMIFFAHDPAKRSVVIGPYQFRMVGALTGAQLLEYGGRATHAEVAARPFMHPAFKKELPGLPLLWRNSVKP